VSYVAAGSVAGSMRSAATQGSVARLLSNVLDGDLDIDELEIKIVRRVLIAMVVAIAALSAIATSIVNNGSDVMLKLSQLSLLAG